MFDRRYENGVGGELGFWRWGAGAAGGTGDVVVIVDDDDDRSKKK
jgi:hypothetical protein